MGDLVRFPAAPQQEPHDRGAHKPVEPLWREALGRELRREREAAGQRLVDTAGAAGVSPQYLSEVERGLKDPSSELLAAMAGALGLTVTELASRVVTGSAHVQGPVCLAA